MSTKRREAYSYDHPINTPVIAIDIGTSMSAMTRTFVGMEGMQQDLIMPKGCGTTSYGQHKIQTAILLRVKSSSIGRRHITSPNEVEAIAFGDHAETEYFSRMPKEERSGYIFLKWFKMELWKPQPPGVTDPVLSNPDGGCTVSLSVALAKTLELFKEGAMEYLQRTKPDIKKEDVVWTLTIPAILEEKAKHLMRTAAFAAEIIDDINSESLNLCLEPEGVCFAALLDEELVAAPGVTRVGGNMGGSVAASASSAAAKLSEECTQLATILKTVGAKFVILDAGGGTMDIAAYEVASAAPFQVKQLAAPTGGEFGGTQVDKQFMLLLRDIIGEESFQALTDRYRHVELEIRRAWETVKVNAKRDPAEAAPAVIQLASLQQEVLAPLGLKLADLIAAYRANRLAAGTASQLCPEAKGDTRMVLPTDLIASLFEPSISKTIECLDKYLTTTRAGEATHLLMAGGYSACPFLWDAVLGHISRLRGDNGERTLTSMHKVTTHPLNASSLMRSLTDFLTPSFTLTPQCMGCTLTNAMRALIYFLTPSFFPPISSVGQQSRYGHCTWSGDIRDRAPRQGGESHREMHLRRGSSGAFQPSQPGPSETNRECGSGSPWTALSACVRKTLDCWSECACRVHF